MSTLVKVQGRDLAPSLLSCPFSRDLERLPWNPAIVGVWSQKRLPWNDCIGCEDLLKSESKSDNFLPVWCTSYLLCAQMAFFHLVCISFPLKLHFLLNCIVCIAPGLHCAAAPVALHSWVALYWIVWIALAARLHWIVWIAQSTLCIAHLESGLHCHLDCIELCGLHKWVALWFIVWIAFCGLHNAQVVRCIVFHFVDCTKHRWWVALCATWCRQAFRVLNWADTCCSAAPQCL